MEQAPQNNSIFSIAKIKILSSLIVDNFMCKQKDLLYQI